MPESITPHRHLRAVSETDDATEDIPLGATWQADTTEPHPELTPQDTEETTVRRTEEPLEATRVVPIPEPTAVLTPEQAHAANLAEKLKARLSAAHTYALLAWSRRWEVSMAYVMDPALRQQMLDEAEDALDQARRRAAKKAKKAMTPEDQQAAQRRQDRLERRVVSELEVDARVLAARGKRLAARCLLPAAVIVGPVLMASAGMWWALVAWPAVWAWLALQGRAQAHSELGATAVSEVEQKAPQLAAAQVGRETVPAQASTPVSVVGASVVENRILAHLAAWETRAQRRGLDGITPDTPTLDELGIAVVLHTSGRLTPADMPKRLPAIRAALKVPKDTKMEIAEGEVGDQALLRIRTRTPKRDLTWAPTRAGIGLDLYTGEVVELTPYHRMLIAGASRSGKTVLLRVLMAMVAQDPTARLVLIDAKQVEAARWRHVARTASTGEEIAELATELRHEMDERYREISSTGDPLAPSPERPRIVVVVDEGAEVIAMDNTELNILSALRSLAMMGGEAEIHLWWCTQKPTMTGPGRGIDNAVAGQMTGARVCLRVTDPKEARTVLGEDATSQGWHAHDLERAGLALVRGTGRGPVPVQVWDMSDVEHIRALPEREPWHYGDKPTAKPADDFAGDEQDSETDDWIGAQGAVLSTLKTSGPHTLSQLEEELDYSKSMIHKTLTDLRAAGRITQVGGRGSAWRLL